MTGRDAPSAGSLSTDAGIMKKKSGAIADPLISSSGRVYSAAGIRRLTAALDFVRVDDRTLCCKGAKSGKKDDESEKRSLFRIL